MKSSGKAAAPLSHVTTSSVLDELGFSPSEALEIRVKAEIYRDLLDYIRNRAFTQQQLCALLGMNQPDVSKLLNGRVSKFSVSKLIQLAGKFNLDAKVKLTTPRSGALHPTLRR